MQQTIFESVAPTPAFDALPIETVQRSSRAGTCLKLALLLPAIAAFSIPMFLVGAHALAEPQALTELSVRPMAAAQILAGIAIWLMLVTVPLVRLVRGAGKERRVTITANEVTVEDLRTFGRDRWTEKLSSYKGVAHHVRASLSGLRHELILVHDVPSRDVLLSIGDRISQETLERAASTLGTQIVPAATIYARGKSIPARTLFGAVPAEPTRLAA